MFQSNPLALHLALALILLIITARVVWQRSVSRSSRYYVYFIAMVSLYVFAYIIELLSANLSLMLWAVRIEYTAMSLIAPTWVGFMLTFVHREHWLKLPPVRLALIVIPLAHILLAWTSDWHQLLYTYAGLQVVDGLYYFDRDYGAGFYVTAAALLLLTMGSITVSFGVALRERTVYARQLLPLLGATIIVWLGALLTVFHDALNPFPHLDFAAISLALTCLPLGWSVLRENLFQMIPTAHRWIVQSMRDPIIIIDADGLIMDMNTSASQILKLPPETTRGKSLRLLAPQIAALLNETVSASGDLLPEFLLTRADGSEVLFEYQQIRLTSANEQWAGDVLVFHDVTIRKQMQAQALKLALEREKVRVARDLVIGVAHDFRTPLSEINLKAYLLSVTNDMEQRRKQLSDVYERVHYIDTLISDIQFIIDLEAAANLATCEQISFTALCETMAAYIAKLSSSKAITFHSEAPPSEAFIFANADHLDRALRKIADNAGKFTPQGGSITMRCDTQTETVALEIEDTGEGIAPEHLPHIFEWFYKPAARSSGGAGLGLSISKVIIEQHGGTISVSSTVGVGSCFRLELPRLRTQVYELAPFKPV